MNERDGYDIDGWMPSVYYAQSRVNCSLEQAWKVLLDYQAWNPSFVGAQVMRIHGEPGTEGEVVRIQKPRVDVKGEPLPEFYAKTVKVVPQRHIVWYVHQKSGDSFRHFVNFGLREASLGVEFNIYYYAQNQLSGEWLARERQANESGLEKLAVAFKNHCEANTPRAV